MFHTSPLVLSLCTFQQSLVLHFLPHMQAAAYSQKIAPELPFLLPFSSPHPVLQSVCPCLQSLLMALCLFLINALTSLWLASQERNAITPQLPSHRN